MTIYSIDSLKVEQNIQTLQRKAGVPLIAVMKNNGYGLGLEWLAKTTRDAGITQFAITELADIAPLRETVGNDADILMLRSTALYGELKVIIENNCIATIGSSAAAHALDLAANRRDPGTSTSQGRYRIGTIRVRTPKNPGYRLLLCA